MSAKSNKESTRKYIRLLRAVSSALYAADADEMSSFGAPLDEFDDAAESLVRELIRCQTREEVGRLAAANYPAAHADLGEWLWRLLLGYRSSEWWRLPRKPRELEHYLAEPASGEG
jgi:hypothetical protein